MPEEAASFSNAGQGANGALLNLAAQQQAARDLTAARRADAQRSEEEPAAHAEIAAMADIEAEADEEQAGRELAAGQRAARRGNGSVGGADLGSALSDITGIADELTDVVTFVVEIETIVVPLLILLKWDLQIIAGNLGVDFMGVLGLAVWGLEKLVDLCSVGGKTAAKAGTGAVGGAAGKSTGSFGGGDFGSAKPQEAAPAGGGSDVKALSTPLLLTAIVLTVVVCISVMVSLIALLIVPIIIVSAVGLACAGFESLCTGIIHVLGSAFTSIRSLLSPG